MKHALIDILTKHYADGKPAIMLNDSADSLLKSVRSHLERLLNSRQGDLAHLPDYGLPDINQIYLDLPSSASILTIAIKKCIEKYEPRLKNISVLPQISDSARSVLDLLITGNLAGGSVVHYVSIFKGDGHASIETRKN